MYRIDVSGAASSLPVPAAPGPNPDSYFQTGTQVTADFLNALQEELCYMVEETGGTLSKTDRTQLYTAIVTLFSTLGLTAIVQDTDPHLGGDLNTNGFGIVSSTDIDFTASGAINLDAPIVLVNVVSAISDQDLNITFDSMSPGFIFKIGGTNHMQLTGSGLLFPGGATVNMFDDDTTLSADSSNRVPTQHAVKSYIDAGVTPGTISETISINLFCNSSIAAGETRYFTFGSATSTNPSGANTFTFVAPWDGTLGAGGVNDYFYFDTAPGGSETYTVTFFKNGVSLGSGAVCTGSSKVTSGGPTGGTVLAGDYITVQVVSSASAATFTYVSGGFSFVPL